MLANTIEAIVLGGQSNCQESAKIFQNSLRDTKGGIEGRNEPRKWKIPAPIQRPGSTVLAEREGFEPSMGF
jgi:hypothetical protein